MALVTAQQIKAFLKITSSMDDALFGDLADRASAVAESYCDRHFALTSYDPAGDPDNALLDGKDLPVVYTPQWPITAVTALKLVQEGNNGDIQVFGATQFAVQRDEGRITLLASAVLQTATRGEVARPVFPRGVQNVAVTYSAGYAAVPFDMQEAVIFIAAHIYGLADQRRLMAQSIAVGGGGVGGTSTFKISDMPDEARARLDRYKSVVPR
jgi:hypothetical protein